MPLPLSPLGVHAHPGLAHSPAGGDSVLSPVNTVSCFGTCSPAQVWELEIKGWRMPAVSTAATIAPLTNSHGASQGSQLERAMPCPQNTPHTVLAQPQKAARSPSATAKVSHRTNHLRTPQQATFGSHPSHQHSTAGPEHKRNKQITAQERRWQKKRLKSQSQAPCGVRKLP